MPSGTDRESSRPTVSVVIAAYNAVPFIERAIRSALDQTHSVAEVIVVDDASTDATVEVVTNLAATDNRVKLIELSANGGPSKARNAGFAAATGDWIAVLDADDAYLPGRLSHLMTMADEADIMADNLLSYDPAKDVASPYPGPARHNWEEIDLLTFTDARRKHHDFGLFQPVFRRGFLEQNKLCYPEDVRHGEDFLFVFEAIALGARYWLSWRPGYLYTERNSGWSRTEVDYASMARHVEALAERRDLNLSPEVLERLADRVALIRDLQIHEQVKQAYHERKPFRAIALGVAHPIIWKTVFGNIKRALIRQHDGEPEFRGSAEYWERRYKKGGNSGGGSYNQLAQFKADLLNGFVARNGIQSVVEFGSGDGAQLELAEYPTYVGVDISRAAIAATRSLFAGDRTKTFLHSLEVPPDLRADVSLSLDVIYHLVEDAVFVRYMTDLFDAASRFAIIYSSNVDERTASPHVRHRRFTDWVASRRPDFTLSEQVPNPFPFDPNNPDNTSFADFYIYERQPIG